MGDYRYHAVVIIRVAEHAFLLKGVDESDVIAHSCQCFGSLGSHGVGVGIENIAHSIVGKRGYYRHGTLLNEGRKGCAVGTIYITYEAKIHHFIDTFDGHLLQRTLVRADDIHVGTGQSDRIDTVGLQFCYKIFVDKAAIYHSYHLQHLSIRDASAAYHDALYAETCGYFGGSSSAAMHKYLLAFYGGEIFQERIELVFALYYCSSYFHYGNLFHYYLYCLVVCLLNAMRKASSCR